MRNLSNVKEIVQFFNEKQSTIKETANHFGISEEIVYHCLTIEMPNEISFFILRKNNELPYLIYNQVIENRLLQNGVS